MKFLNLMTLYLRQIGVSVKKIIFLTLILLYSCKKVDEVDLSTIQLSKGMPINDVMDSIKIQPSSITDVRKSYVLFDLQIIFVDENGRLDVYFDKNLKLAYYSYDD